MTDSDLKAIHDVGPRQALLELLSEDNFGLWEIASFLGKADIQLPEVKDLVGNLYSQGTIFIEGRLKSNDERIDLPNDFTLSSDDVWHWPLSTPSVLYWAGLVEQGDRHLVEGTRLRLRAGKRIAYTRFVASWNDDEPRLVDCIGRGEILADLGNQPGVGWCWLIDDDEDGSDLPVPVENLWLDDHPSVSRYRYPSSEFLKEMLISDTRRAIRAPDAHSAFDVGLCIVNLLGEAIDLGGGAWVDRVEVVANADGDDHLDVSGAAFALDPIVKDDQGRLQETKEAISARIDLDAAELRIQVVEREGEWQYSGAVALA